MIVDRLNKFMHFLSICGTYTLQDLTMLYVKEIVSLYGVLVFIISNRDMRFTSRFLESSEIALGIKLCFNTIFHPQIDW